MLILVTMLSFLSSGVNGDDHVATIYSIEGLVSFGMWQGLNNQRLCFTSSFLMAERLGYGVLLVRTQVVRM